MAIQQPGKPRFVSCDETSISLEWDADPALCYKVQYKEYPQPWDQAASHTVPPGEGKLTASIPDLQPCSTYNLRLVAVSPEGVESEPGDEIVIDTQSMSCTPRPKKPKSCVIS